LAWEGRVVEVLAKALEKSTPLSARLSMLGV